MEADLWIVKQDSLIRKHERDPAWAGLSLIVSIFFFLQSLIVVVAIPLFRENSTWVIFFSSRRKKIRCPIVIAVPPLRCTRFPADARLDLCRWYPHRQGTVFWMILKISLITDIITLSFSLCQHRKVEREIFHVYPLLSTPPRRAWTCNACARRFQYASRAPRAVALGFFAKKPRKTPRVSSRSVL